MLITFEDRGSDSPVIDRVWRSHSDRAGTFVSMVQASEFVRVIEERQGFKIGCVEEACWRAGLIDDDRLRSLAEPLLKSGYGQYLLDLLQEEKSR